ncbi:MAG: NAD(P)/FAD-dependent oxidoreductase [Methylomonas sp.]|jgi:thioredoxin reductase
MDATSNTSPVIAIIGGGPAGMSCALWLKLMGLSPNIIERNAALGGQLLYINRINRWVLGLPNRTSVELAELYGKHISEENIPVKYNTQLTAVESAGSDYRLFLQESDQNPTSILVQAIVIATGVRVLNREIFSQIPEFDTLAAMGRIGVFPTDHIIKLENLSGKTAAVIGGGDNAHYTAKDLASTAARTYLLIRSQPKAHSRIRKEVETLIEQGLVIEYTQTTVDAFRQVQDGVEIFFTTSGSVVANIKVDMVFTRTGFTPNSEFLNKLIPFANIRKLADGYLFTDTECRTSIASVYAIGDVRSPRMQSVVTAIADGAKAARTIETDLGAKEGF